MLASAGSIGACLAPALLLMAAATSRAQTDPARDEVLLPAAAGWQASLVYESDVGIWTVGSAQCFPRFGCPELFGLDDKGRCTILVGYSGKWMPQQTVADGMWLGAFALVDLDPRRADAEIYTGGQRGNLYQIIAHPEGGFDTAIVARFPAREIHAIAAGDLLPERAGNELLAFLHDGGVYDLRAQGAAPGFEAVALPPLAGRVREAVVLSAAPGERPWMVAAARFGEVLLLRMRDDGIEQQVLTREPMGFGRVAVKKGAGPADPLVFYATRDDGVIVRLEGRPGAAFKREVIYAGPQGPRGVAAGRFDADPRVETLAVFGYSQKIQMLSRRPGAEWQVETLFEDRDKGHWLATCEVDGRNATDELVASGYGKRIILLAREPGYGLAAVPTDAPREQAMRPHVRRSARAQGAACVCTNRSTAVTPNPS